MTRGREYRASSYEDQLLHWRTHARPSRWPRLLAALSYAEKLVSAATPQTRTADCHVSLVCAGGVLRPGGGAVAGPHREAGPRVRLRDVLLERSDAGEDK